MIRLLGVVVSPFRPTSRIEGRGPHHHVEAAIRWCRIAVGRVHRDLRPNIQHKWRILSYCFPYIIFLIILSSKARLQSLFWALKHSADVAKPMNWDLSIRRSKGSKFRDYWTSKLGQEIANWLTFLSSNQATTLMSLNVSSSTTKQANFPFFPHLYPSERQAWHNEYQIIYSLITHQGKST